MKKKSMRNLVSVLAVIMLVMFFASNAPALTELPPLPPSDGGCTLTPGYWKTHSAYGPAPADDVWGLIPPDGEDNPFYQSGKTFYQVLWTNPKGGNAYYILAHQYIAACLNYLSGATVPNNVATAMHEARDLFVTYTPAQIGALGGDDPLRAQFIRLAAVLDAFNSGIIGPGHCNN